MLVLQYVFNSTALKMAITTSHQRSMHFEYWKTRKCTYLRVELFILFQTLKFYSVTQSLYGCNWDLCEGHRRLWCLVLVASWINFNRKIGPERETQGMYSCYLPECFTSEYTVLYIVFSFANFFFTITSVLCVAFPSLHYSCPAIPSPRPPSSAPPMAWYIVYTDWEWWDENTILIFSPPIPTNQLYRIYVLLL